jgi:hypothetical protein
MFRRNSQGLPCSKSSRTVSIFQACRGETYKEGLKLSGAHRLSVAEVELNKAPPGGRYVRRL